MKKSLMPTDGTIDKEKDEAIRQTNKKLRYNMRVKILDGFWKGSIGILEDYDPVKGYRLFMSFAPKNKVQTNHSYAWIRANQVEKCS